MILITRFLILLSLQPSLCDVTGNYCICCVLGRDHFDVYLVYTWAILPPQHFFHYLDLGTPPTNDQCLSSSESKFWSSFYLSFHSSYNLTCCAWIICLKQVNAGILTPGLMGLYVVFICWCAIRRHAFLSFFYLNWMLLFDPVYWKPS